MDDALTAAVVFDLDGVLLDSETVWNDVKRELTLEVGGRWTDEAPTTMLGMSAPEWSRFMHDELLVPLDPRAISDAVVERLEARYRADLPIIPGAIEAVKRMASRWPLGLASSSNPEIIELVPRAERPRGLLRGRTLRAGNRAREAGARRRPRRRSRPSAFNRGRASRSRTRATASRAAHSAGLRVVAIPNPDFPPGDDALAQADVILGSIAELTPAVVT